MAGHSLCRASSRQFAWKAPRALSKQKEKVKAFKFSDACPQVPSISLDRGGSGEYTGSEDCLYLNIFTPKK